MQVLNANKYKMLNDPMIVRILLIFIYNVDKAFIQKVFRLIDTITLQHPQYIYTIHIIIPKKSNLFILLTRNYFSAAYRRFLYGINKECKT